MRKLFLISVIIFHFCKQTSAQVNISVECQDTWGPGRFNKVILKINKGSSNGFARFTQEFPVGFAIIEDYNQDADFIWVNNQLNLVWIRLPDDPVIIFSYYIQPDKTMNGTFMMTGKYICISGGDTRQTAFMREKPITIGGSNGIPAEEIRSKTIVKSGFEDVRKNAAPVSLKTERLVFRVQVATGSSNIPEDELKKGLGINSGEGVTVVRSGNKFKYQIGSFSTYNDADRLLKRLIASGIIDAFVVAYKGEEQIPVDDALSPVK